MGLSIKDILLLDYFDGKPAHHKVPPYKESIYGRDANDRIGELFDDGWIRMSRPQEDAHHAAGQSALRFPQTIRSLR